MHVLVRVLERELAASRIGQQGVDLGREPRGFIVRHEVGPRERTRVRARDEQVLHDQAPVRPVPRERVRHFGGCLRET